MERAQTEPQTSTASSPSPSLARKISTHTRTRHRTDVEEVADFILKKKRGNFNTVAQGWKKR